MPRIILWTPTDEKILFNFVVAHSSEDMKIDWTDAGTLFPDRSEAQCKSKFYRMIKQSIWNFEQAVRNRYKTKPSSD